jgi:Na+/H+-dicarboxylate symporter
MFDRAGKYLTLATLTGLILAVVAVALFGESMLPAKFLGDIFVHALLIVVAPLILCSVILGISNLGDSRKLGRVGLKAMTYYLATGASGALIGLVLASILSPGAGFGTTHAAIPAILPDGGAYSFFGWLANLVPTSLAAAALDIRILTFVIAAVFLGVVLLTLGPRGKPVLTVVDGLNEALTRIVRIIFWFAPIGVFGLVAGQLALQGGLDGMSMMLSRYSGLLLVLVLGIVIQGVVVLPLILNFMGGKSVFEFFVGMGRALVTGLATGSAAATLPVTVDCVQEKNNIDKRATAFAVPLGTALAVDATALYSAVAALFIAQAYGVSLSIVSMAIIFVVSVLGSIGTAGLPMAGLMAISATLAAAGLPLEGIGLLVAVDWLIDRLRTPLTVWNISIGAAVVASTAEIGLIDRRTKKEAWQPRPTQYREGQRRDGYRDNRRGPDAHRRPADASAAPRGEAVSKGSSQQRPFRSDRSGRPDRPDRPERPDRSERSDRPERSERSERPDRPDRHDRPDRRGGDRYGDKWSSRRGQRTDESAPVTRREETAPSAKREEYRPEPASTPEPKETVRDQESSGQSRPVYGRRQGRSQYVRGRQQQESEKPRVPSEELASEVDKPVVEETTSTSEFVMPKFPDRILEELAGTPKEPAEPVTESPSAQSADAVDEVTGGGDRFNDDEITAVQIADRQEKSHDEGSSNENPFAELDKAFRGYSGSGRGDRVEESSGHESTGEYAEAGPSADQSAERSGGQADISGGDAASFTPERFATDPEPESSREETATGAGAESGPSPADDASNSDSDNRDDDSPNNMWGRHKQKKPSR